MLCTKTRVWPLVSLRRSQRGANKLLSDVNHICSFIIQFPLFRFLCFVCFRGELAGRDEPLADEGSDIEGDDPGPQPDADAEDGEPGPQPQGHEQREPREG